MTLSRESYDSAAVNSPLRRAERVQCSPAGAPETMPQASAAGVFARLHLNLGGRKEISERAARAPGAALTPLFMLVANQPIRR
jgi:hypothetical protein